MSGTVAGTAREWRQAPPDKSRLLRVRNVLDAKPSSATAAIWALWLVVGLSTIAVGLATGAYVNRADWPVRHGLWPLFSWDYGWYARIARDGYPGDAGGGRYAFYPLWPLLLRASGPLPDAVMAVAVAWAASAAAFAGVAAGAARPGWPAALALACWPGSFALLLAYPDGVALAAAVWAVVLAKRQQTAASAALAAVAAFARPNGVLIALPLVWLARGRGVRAWTPAGAAITAALAVQGYFWARSGSPTAFFDAQNLWRRRGPGHWVESALALASRHPALILLAALAGVPAVVLLWRRVGFWAAAVFSYSCAVAVALVATNHLRGRVDLASIAVAVPLLVVLWRLGRSWRPWAAFATAVVATLLLSGATLSFPRQVLFAFPLFWALGEAPTWLRKLPLAALGLAANVGYVLLLTQFAP